MDLRFGSLSELKETHSHCERERHAQEALAQVLITVKGAALDWMKPLTSVFSLRVGPGFHSNCYIFLRQHTVSEGGRVEVKSVGYILQYIAYFCTDKALHSIIVAWHNLQRQLH